MKPSSQFDELDLFNNNVFVEYIHVAITKFVKSAIDAANERCNFIHDTIESTLSNIIDPIMQHETLIQTQIQQVTLKEMEKFMEILQDTIFKPLLTNCIHAIVLIIENAIIGSSTFIKSQFHRLTSFNRQEIKSIFQYVHQQLDQWWMNIMNDMKSSLENLNTIMQYIHSTHTFIAAFGNTHIFVSFSDYVMDFLKHLSHNVLHFINLELEKTYESFEHCQIMIYQHAIQQYIHDSKLYLMELLHTLLISIIEPIFYSTCLPNCMEYFDTLESTSNIPEIQMLFELRAIMKYELLLIIHQHIETHIQTAMVTMEPRFTLLEHNILSYVIPSVHTVNDIMSAIVITSPLLMNVILPLYENALTINPIYHSSLLTELVTQHVSESCLFITSYDQIPRNRMEYIQHYEYLHKMNVNFEWKIENILNDGNKIIIYGEISGNPQSNFLGMNELTGNTRYHIPIIDILTLEYDQITCIYSVADWMLATTQLAHFTEELTQQNIENMDVNHEHPHGSSPIHYTPRRISLSEHSHDYR